MNQTRREFCLGVTWGVAGVVSNCQDDLIKKNPEQYWEVVYRCPRGHEQTMFVARSHFDPSDLDATMNASAFCDVCYLEWISAMFPPQTVALVKAVSVRP